jgi:tetratricopeptide (TPR) repeat protein
MKPAIVKVRRNAVAKLSLLAFLCLPLGLQAQGREYAASPSQANSQQTTPADPQIEQKIVLAEGFHDLAILYVKKGELDKAVDAARQIILLRFPPEYEKAVAQSLSIITEKLAEIKRFDLGLGLLDEALKASELNANRVKILRNKARIYMLAGDNDRAIDSWRRALELESKRSR